MDVVKRFVIIMLAAVVPMICSATARVDVETALDQWQPLITEAAQRFGIPAPWIRDVMRAESAGQAFIDDQPTTSTAGAMGLMQIMPAIYAELRERYDLGDEPYDPRNNILAGAAYLHELYERYGWPSLFAAYHAGPARFEEYLSTGRPLPTATVDYLAALVPETSGSRRAVAPFASASSIFISLKHTDSVTTTPPLSADDRLFVRLRTSGMGANAALSDHQDASGESSYESTPR